MIRLDDVIARVRSMELRRGLDRARDDSADLDVLMHALDDLEQRIAATKGEVAAETKRHLADLEELQNANRMSTVGTLAMGLAHEFGTPLGVVLARAQMIIESESELVEARKDASEIVAQVKRMTRMCREVLDYARPQAPTRFPVDMVLVVRQMVALLLLDARKRTVALVCAGDPPPTLVLGDSSKLMQVLTNLIINASQAMPKGGTVTVSVERRRLSPPSSTRLPDGDYVCVDVKDTGTGIAPDDLGHIFESFFTTKKAGEGTGLGLAVSSRIVREHQGAIGVVSELGRGSVFTIYLPPLAART